MTHTTPGVTGNRNRTMEKTSPCGCGASLTHSTPNQLLSNLFCDIVFKFNLSQFVNLPTHIYGNIPDLILSNDSDLVKNIIIHSIQDNHLVSDHYMITFSTPCDPPKSKASSHYVLNCSKVDWNGLSSYLLDYDISPLYVLIEHDAI